MLRLRLAGLGEGTRESVEQSGRVALCGYRRGSDFFGQCPFCFTGGAFGAVYGRYMPDAERN